MNSVQRVLDALNHKIPDKVPYMYSHIAHNIREEILGEKITYKYPEGAGFGPYCKPGEEPYMEPSECIDARVARKLGLDAIGVQYFPPFFVDVDKTRDGILYIKSGLLTSREALNKIKLPDVDDERLYDCAEEFVKKYKGEFALYCRIRLGISYMLNSMGLEDFSFLMYDDPDMVKEALDMYTDWVAKLIRNLIEIGFDFIWTFDDMAYRTSPMFSNAVWDEFFYPYLKKAADAITIPWIFHSDGNLLPIMDRLLKLGMNGIHPLEPGSMDLKELKQKYGDKVCLIGNIDIDHTLTTGTEEEIYQEVKERIELLGPGGNYIISDSNSIPGYCSSKNVMLMAKAVEKYRNIY